MSNNQNNHNWSQTIGLLAGAAVVGGGIYALTKGLQSLFETEPEHQNSNADRDVEATVPACILAVRKLTKFVANQNNSKNMQQLFNVYWELQELYQLSGARIRLQMGDASRRTPKDRTATVVRSYRILCTYTFVSIGLHST